MVYHRRFSFGGYNAFNVSIIKKYENLVVGRIVITNTSEKINTRLDQPQLPMVNNGYCCYTAQTLANYVMYFSQFTVFCKYRSMSFLYEYELEIYKEYDTIQRYFVVILVLRIWCNFL